MKRLLLILAITFGYWITVGLLLVAAVNAWPWLANPPWLYAAVIPFFVLSFALRWFIRTRFPMKGGFQP